jgi:hypothetical protein
MKSSAVTLISWAFRGLLRLKEILFPVKTTDFKLTEAKSDARNRVAGANSVANLASMRIVRGTHFLCF